MTRPLRVVLSIVLLAGAPSVTGANGDGVASGPPTVFERFVLSACTPCVRESYPVAALAAPSVPLPASLGRRPARRPGPGRS